ncbi:MAG TPA: hypothetical protein VFE10_02565 [Phenylobacterium sp.]|jgi:hypothetical protein|nr:hypothetical protein [Phenylobacterium sp.]
MSDPQELPSAKSQRRSQASSAGKANFPDAPGLRNLAFLATGLTVAAVVLAVPALRDQGPAARPPVAAPAATAAHAAPTPVAPVTASPSQVPIQAAPPPAPIPHAPVREAPAQTLAAATPQAQTQAQPVPQPLSCNINPQSLMAPFSEGVIKGIEDPQVSLRRIRGIELRTGGAIDPSYVATLRVIVQSPAGLRLTPALPPGLVVHVGDRVTVMSGERNAGLPCNYVPPHVTADLGPAKPPESGTAAPLTP